MSAGSKNDYFWRHGKSASTPSSVLESPQDLGKFLSHQSNQIQKLQDQMNSLLRRQQQVDVDLEMSSSGDASTSSHNRYLIHCMIAQQPRLLVFQLPTGSLVSAMSEC